ncbi:MAG: hypothetical protein MUW56_05715 [Chryseobacterium sp.]|uniref:hypothetical protein n=1 Tax=Chryseobacterium sp. TaxID=1871047 RepID=UPI0025BF8556|nr:hypothetical protein [Chryseobacterium sp.]MCJ7933131.1 hypothetical protein [Chryseobacterium sp.]
MISQLLFLIALVTFLHSCRTDEITHTTEETQQEKISFFEKFEKNLALSKSTETNYAKPFAQCIEYYFENNTKTQEFFNSKYGYFDRNVSTQSIDGDEGEKLIFFPILDENRKVTAILAGVVNGSRDYLYYDVWVNEHPDVLYIISRFQEYYDNLSKNRSDTTEIDPIVITVIRPIKLTSYDIWMEGPTKGNGGQGGGHLASGGNGNFGGGIGNPPATNTNPCEQTKKIITNPKSKPVIDSLKQQSTLGGEKGAKFKTDGTPSGIIHGGAHSVNFGDKTGYAGGYHNHTPTGIPMLSPPDIDQLLGFARAQPTSNPANVKNAFVGMIAPNGIHYVIWFNGTYQDALTNFSQDSLNKYTQKYRKLEKDLTDETISGMKYMNSDGSINNLGVEKLFFETLKSMGLEGKVNLQRIENDGTVKNINLDNNSQPIPTSC